MGDSVAIAKRLLDDFHIDLRESAFFYVFTGRVHYVEVLSNVYTSSMVGRFELCEFQIRIELE